jgi:hypothetical protein
VDNRYFRVVEPILLGLFFVTNSADLVTTVIALNLGLHEQNPIAQVSPEWGFALLFALKVCLSAVALVWALRPKEYWQKMNPSWYLFLTIVTAFFALYLVGIVIGNLTSILLRQLM